MFFCDTIHSSYVAINSINYVPAELNSADSALTDSTVSVFAVLVSDSICVDSVQSNSIFPILNSVVFNSVGSNFEVPSSMKSSHCMILFP